MNKFMSELKQKEDIFGAANMAMILAVMSLAVVKPSLRRGSKSKAQFEKTVI